MWSIQEVWNKALKWQVERPVLSRDYIWASELGGAFADRYLRMKGTPPTNLLYIV